MRKFALILFCSAFFFTGSAFASCSMSPAWNGILYVYTLNENLLSSTQGPCFSFDSGTSFSSPDYDCLFNAGMWKFTGIGQNISSGAFTVGSGDSGGTHFQLSFNASVVSPNHSLYDQVTAGVTVVHNGVPTNYNLFSYNGTQGGDISCAAEGGSFTAQNGDTIYIGFNGSTSGDTGAFNAVSNVWIGRYAP